MEGSHTGAEPRQVTHDTDFRCTGFSGGGQGHGRTCRDALGWSRAPRLLGGGLSLRLCLGLRSCRGAMHLSQLGEQNQRALSGGRPG